jgi:hypothetical protein
MKLGNELTKALIPTTEMKVKTIQKDEVIKRLQVRYVKYFKHWRDFDLLTMILAMIGLVLMIVDVSFKIVSLNVDHIV